VHRSNHAIVKRRAPSYARIYWRKYYKPILSRSLQWYHWPCRSSTFDGNIITYSDLLKVYFLTHDPTTLNRQGGDVGTQYRSSIFTHSDEQRKIASDIIEDLGNQAIWPNPIVTEVVDFNKFYEAEPYHLDYYKNNPNASYCTFIIEPKLAKMKSILLDSLK
jgi:peptide-methionine (S)-S-oxide reductase